MAEAHAYRPPSCAAMLWANHALLCLVVALCALFSTAHFAHASDPIRDYRYGYDYEYEYDAQTGQNVGSGSGTRSQASSGVGDLQITESFACNADGSTRGILFVNEQCEVDGLLGVFANVVCRIENLFGTILGLIYCAVQNAIIEPLLALFTLYVTVYGAMVILGMVSHSFSEAISRVFKIALVAAIALNADIAIGVGYKFYISAAQSTVGIVLDIFDPDQPNLFEDNPAMLTMIESGYMASPTNPDESKVLRSGNHWLESFDATVHKILGFFVSSGVSFITVMLGLLFLMPPLFLMIVYLMISIFKAFAQAIIGYLLALLGITFLFTVAPLFVAFALFRVTAGWFEVWLKYLASFTLQMMLVFTFLMFMVMIDLVTFFQSIGLMVRQYEYIFKFGTFIRTDEVYTLCHPVRDGGFTAEPGAGPINEKMGEIIYYKFNQHGIMSDQTGSRYEGFPRCIEPYTLEDVMSGTRYPPGLDAQSVENLRETAATIRNMGDVVPGADQMPRGWELVQQIINTENDKLHIPFMELITTTDLLSFLLVRLLVVIILTYLLDRFMKKVPHLASYLAGTGFSGRLGGGEYEPGDSPGVQETTDFAGLDSGFAKFKNTMYADGYYPRNMITGAPGRLANATKAAVSGAGYGMIRKGMVNAGNLGLRGDLRRELAESSEILESQREGLFAGGRGGIGKPTGVYHPGGRGGRTMPSTFKGPRRSRRGL